MKPLISFARAKSIDHLSQNVYAIPDIVLMEHAGQLLVQQLVPLLSRESALCVLCGSGNNGGDAQVLAREFHNRGYAVSVSFVREACSTLALQQRAMLRACGVPLLPLPRMERKLRALRDIDWIVDGITGVGLTRPLNERRLLQTINQSRAKRLAVDLPSGLSEEMNLLRKAEPMVHADITVTFGHAKTAMYYPNVREHCGEIIVVNPGFPSSLLAEDTQKAAAATAATGAVAAAQKATAQGAATAATAGAATAAEGAATAATAAEGAAAAATEAVEAKGMEAMLIEPEDLSLLPALPNHIYKHQRGVVAVAAGSKKTPGAALLALQAATRSFAGMVYALLDEDLRQMAATAAPSAITGMSLEEIPRLHALAVGPGWGEGREPFFQQLLSRGVHTVVDADALSCLHAAPRSLFQGQARLVLTPHPGELRMLNPSYAEHGDLWQAAQQLSQRYNAVVVAKNSVTAVVYGERVFVVDGRNPALANAGSGDVLSGLLGSYLACCTSMSGTSSKKRRSPLLPPAELHLHSALAVLLHAQLAHSLSAHFSSAEDLPEALQNYSTR